MTPERWQQIKALLEAALERTSAERDAFLAEACASDPTLRDEVESLILSSQRAAAFIEEPAVEMMAGSLANSESLVGRSLGPYYIIARLGGGGMGEVYLAEDTRLGRKIALKTLPAHFTREEERVRRFQQEARAASALSHPNIITIFEIGQIDSLNFMTTEFIDGLTLRQHMVQHSMKIAEALEVATYVASALCAAHEAGIVHRDIKPENIMLRTDGIVKVLDFGLVKLAEQKSVFPESPTLLQTAEGTVMGTVQYMSPEQARGLAVDARTDIWSLGVVIYEMVGGRVPFEGATGSDVLATVLEREPVPLARYAPDVPNELEWIIKKALRKNKEERYQTARELLADLKNLNQRLEFEQELERSVDNAIPTRRSQTSSSRVITERQSQQTIDSIAILPLTNHTADQGMEYFSDGITESVINALSQLPDLRVMAWSTVSRYKEQQVDPREAGRDLAVRAVLTGRVLRAGEHLVIKTEMVDTLDGSHLWGESYTCKPSEILDVEAEISSEISEKLLLRLTTEERKQLERRYTENVEAYHAYLRGRHCWNKRTDESLRKAIEYFKQAIDIDPSYALAYAGVADSYLMLGSFGIATMAPQEAFPRAREATMRALKIDETLAEAHASLGYCLANYDWNWPAAEAEFKRTLALKPNYPTAHHWYGFIYLAAMGQLDQAILETNKALELDPLSLPVSANVGLLLYLAGRYDEAMDQFRKTLELDKGFVYTYWQMALTLEQQQMYEEAIAECEKAIALSGTSTLLHVLLARIFASAGRKSEALAQLGSLHRLSKERYVSPYRIAAVYSALGDNEQAFQWLERAYEGRDAWLIWLKVDPVMYELRSDRRFHELLVRIGLSDTEGLPPTEEAKDDPAERARALSPVPREREKRSFLKLATAVGVLVLVAAGLYFFLRPRERASEVSAPGIAGFSQLTYQSGPEFFPSLSPDGELLAYAGRSSGNWDIYLQTVGGNDPINLTKDSTADDSQPAFSPDGKLIAFRSERDGGGIFLLDRSGKSVARVSDFGYSPSWSPEGDQILIGTEKIPQPSTRPTKSQLWRIDIKTGERRMLSAGDALQPYYSPHKQRIAYWSRPNKAGQREDIWTIPAEGGEAVRVTSGSTTDMNPIWSPDGKYLYFSSSRGGSMNVWRTAIDEKSGVTEGAPVAVTTIGAASSALHLSLSANGRRLVYIAQEDIRNLRKIALDPSTGKTEGDQIPITGGSLQLWFPAASPDGQLLAACSRGQQRHVYTIRPDGTDLRDLTNDNYRHDGWPRWSPDSQRIAFTSRRTGDYELWMVNRDGSGLRQVTQSSGGHYSPWSADGSMIAYSIHVPKNDCVVMHPDKVWSEQKLTYLPALSDTNISFEGWSWSQDGKRLAGIRHLPNGIHSGIGIYDFASGNYDWLTDFGDWPIWFNDNRRLLFVSQGKIFLFDTRTRKYQQVMSVTDQDVDIGSPGLSPDNRVLYFTFVAAEADIWLMTLQ